MIIRAFALLLCFLAAGSATSAEVRLRSAASCTATVVRLGDIAEIQADDPAIAADLAAVPLFPAPIPGKSRQLDRHQVRQFLAISGIDLQQISIGGSETVVVQCESGSSIARPALRVGGEPSAIRLASLESEVAAKRQKPATPAPVEPPLLVKKGESVTVHSRAAGVRISTSGKALSDGVLGAEISIELADKRTKIVARVAGPQTVEINASRP